MEEVKKQREFLATSPRAATPVGHATGGGKEAPGSLGFGNEPWRGTRWFGSGSKFLGYLEGRPNLKGILRYNTSASGSKRPKAEVPRDVHRRIVNSPMVQSAPKEQRKEMVEWLEDVWDACDYDGAEVEEELDKGT